MMRVKVFLEYGASIEQDVKSLDEAMKYIDELKTSMQVKNIEYSLEYNNDGIEYKTKLDQCDNYSEMQSLVDKVTYH